MDKEMIQLMKKAGCWQIALGIEVDLKKYWTILTKGLL